MIVSILFSGKLFFYIYNYSSELNSILVLLISAIKHLAKALFTELFYPGYAIRIGEQGHGFSRIEPCFQMS